MKQDKICGICNLVIDENKEFIELIQYENKNKVIKRLYYHILCYINKISAKTKLTEMQDKTIKLLNRFVS